MSVLVAAVALVLVSVYLRRRGLEQDAKLSEIISAALAVGVAMAPAASRLFQLVPAPRLKSGQVESDVDDSLLPCAFGPIGRTPSGRHVYGLYLYDRLPMPVRWLPGAWRP